MTLVDHLLFALAWISFGVVHSLLATERANARFQPITRAFTRIAYNAVATVHLAAILILEWRGFPDKTVFDIPLWLDISMVAVQVAGWILLFVALVQYDLGRFGGLTQARVIVHRRDNGPATAMPGSMGQAPTRQHDTAVEVPHKDLEPLVTHGVHRFVRHPLYTALFMVLWGRAFDEAALMTAVWGSLYLVIGTRFEERKLRRIYGTAYETYSARTPRFVPWPGKADPRRSRRR